MNDFWGVIGSGDVAGMRAVLDAPCRILRCGAFCAESCREGGDLAAAVSGRIRNGRAVIEMLREAGERVAFDEPPEGVALAAYRVWGERFYEKLEGSACVALVDCARRFAVLSRDRMGEGSVFYADRGGALSFASRAAYLLRAPNVEKCVDADGLRELFALGPARTPGRTPLRDVRELEPGCALVWEGGRTSVRRYFALEAREHEDDEQKSADAVRSMLERAADDVKGLTDLTMLSGGLDSAVLTALLASRRPVKSFSVDYEDNDRYFAGGSDYQCSEDAPWARRAARFLGTAHAEVILTPAQLVESLPDALRARGFPGMADVDASLLRFARAIAKSGPYALSGECGDEVFGGYPWFRRESLIRAPLFPWSGSMPLRESVLKPSLREKLGLTEYAKARCDEALSNLPTLPGEGATDARLRALQGLCFRCFMPNLQERARAMGRAAGLTILTPFSDERLAQYVYNVPWRIKQMGGMEKGLLRAAARGLLPDDMRLRKKSPYPKTYHPAYGQMVAERLTAILNDPKSPILAVVDADNARRLAGGTLSPKDAPWFGQLMTLPQLLGYLIAVNDWLRLNDLRVEA